MQKVALFILILLLILPLTSMATTDQTLDIKLDPTEAASTKESQTDLSLKHETLGATRSQTKQTTPQTRKTASSGKKDAAIGRVGVVTASKADIRSYPGSKSGRLLFSCPKETYIAVTGYSGNWYAVLMADQSNGWVEKSKVELLDYQVMSPSSPQYGETGNQIVNTALKYLGIRYRWGGYSLGGIDCSGFVKAVFAVNGMRLPRVARDQAQVGTPVNWTDLRAGDRLYFACKGGAVDHAGIYIGNGLFIHSSTGRGGVAIDKIMKPLFAKSLITARR